MLEKNPEKFDVVVIGGGPAGMMAAGRAAELGARVALLEKNSTLGKKLLITGKGRCNITQAEFVDREFIKKLGKNGKFIFSALAAFGPEEVISFFESRGLATKVERGGRVFPVSDRSQDVLEILQKYLQQKKVRVINSAQVLKFNLNGEKIGSVELREKKIYADQFILASGGKAYPATGATGDGYRFVEKLGHTVITPAPALVPLKIKESWVADLQGLSLKNIQINILQNNKKQDTRFGEMLFTHFGLSGPIILDVSKKIGQLLRTGEVQIAIDLKPALDAAQLDQRLQRDFAENNNKDFKNYLPELLPQKLINLILDLSEIPADRKLNFITRDERKKLILLLKGLRVTVEKLLDYNQAIVTSGGVDLKEVDSKTMRSKKIPNLFLAGEVLDLDGPTGGYNLQISWSTGYAAGTYATQKT